MSWEAARRLGAVVRHVVVAGDNLSKIAHQYGIYYTEDGTAIPGSWRTIYDHPLNDALREKRRNPGLIMPGDVIYVPVRRER